MKKLKHFITLVWIVLFFTGCLHTGNNAVVEKQESSPEVMKPHNTKDFFNDKQSKESYKEISMGVLKTESKALESNVQKRREYLENKAQKTMDVEPVLPVYNPLEDHLVSFSMVDESLETILYLLADTVGMNLILGKNLEDSQRTTTLHFQNVPAKIVLDELTHRFDLSYQINGNVIRISPFAERHYILNFLDTNVETSFDIGGDVLGASNTDTISGLSGSVRLKGTGAKKGNAYDILEEMVKKVKSTKGIFSINRLAGSLYVKDKPSVIKVISRLVNHFKETLARQILIEARIIEVTLADGYEYGIDWSLLRHEAETNHKLTRASWSLQNGLVLSGINSTFNLTAAISALEAFGNVKIVSNPTIRARHGNPAIISVGDSISYKKSVDVTNNQNSNDATYQTVEVEVSTVFDGLILGVIPFIEESGKINLLINPVKSDVDTNSIENPESVGNGESISLPKVGIKEINTTISMNNGDVVVLGGLISKEHNKRDQNVPVLSHIPLFGYLFKNKYLKQVRKELVIILSVNII